MSVLESLKDNNEFPVLFIGSGISKRYLENYPSWEELLHELWVEYIDDDFYNYLNKISQNNSNSEDGKKFDIYIQTATQLEEQINTKFNQGEIKIENLTPEIVFKKEISPFKYILSKKFLEYDIKPGVEEEIIAFRDMILKSQVIFTTNYDTFIENEYDKINANGLEKFIGQRGLFQSSPSYAEIYKIHGCATDNKSLIITKKDYQTFDRNSVLITSKLISLLLHSPIIFLGYSLTDRNIKKIIKDFSMSLNKKEKESLKNRIVVIDYKKDEHSLVESVEYNSNLECYLTIIKTDNFKAIYDIIGDINQGVAPIELRRYYHLIKELIVDRGKKGNLNKLLVTPEVLDNLDASISNENLVLAMGDKTTLYIAPTIVEYCLAYIQEDFNQDINVVLRFLAGKNSTELLPMKEYLTDDNINNANITKKEKDKLKNYRNKHNDLKEEKQKLKQIQNHNNLNEILRNYHNQKDKIYKNIAYNINNIKLESIKEFIIEELMEFKNKGDIKLPTELRRLCLIYDLYKYSQKGC